MRKWKKVRKESSEQREEGEKEERRGGRRRKRIRTEGGRRGQKRRRERVGDETIKKGAKGEKGRVRKGGGRLRGCKQTGIVKVYQRRKGRTGGKRKVGYRDNFFSIECILQGLN